MGFLSSASARADQFTFSTNLTSGPDQGVLTGTFNLAFITNQGSGTGAATGFTFTSVPAGFGTLVGGNVATSWADQASNSFTVVNGVVTSDLFFAATGGSQPADVFCLNSTASTPSVGNFVCPSQLNELNASSTVFGYNFGGLSGVTFTDTTPTSMSVTPEPSSIALLATGVMCMARVVRRRLV